MSKTRTASRSVLAILALAGSVFVAACSDPQQPPQPVSSNSYPAPGSPGARLLMDRCSHCHAPPQPAVHGADEWPGVVYRMQNHMVRRGYETFDEAERKTLLDYLGEHARRGP